MIDAVSAYGAGGGTRGGAPFVDTIVKSSLAGWDAEAAAGKKIIPTVAAGADARPRAWDGPTPCPWGNFSDSYVIDPTMAELEDFTLQGLSWVTKNRAAAETNVNMASDHSVCCTFKTTHRLKQCSRARSPQPSYDMLTII